MRSQSLLSLGRREEESRRSGRTTSSSSLPINGVFVYGEGGGGGHRVVWLSFGQTGGSSVVRSKDGVTCLYDVYLKYPHIMS